MRSKLLHILSKVCELEPLTTYTCRNLLSIIDFHIDIEQISVQQIFIILMMN